jgi:uncharacterized protein (TIRG00374 family)
VVTQVRWTDEVVLADGKTVVGKIVGGGHGEGLSIVPEGESATRRIAPEEMRVERYGGRDIPKVTYGFPTLAARLSGRFEIVALVILGVFALEILTAWRWRWLVLALGLALSGRDALRFTFYGLFFNLVVPGATGGDVVRAYYAAKRTGAPAKAVVSVLVDRLVGLFALVLLAAVVLFLGPDHEGFQTPRRLVLLVLAGGAVFGVLFLSRRVRRAVGVGALLSKLPFQRVLREVDAAFRLYHKHPGFLAAALGVSIVNHAGVALAAYALAQALGLTEVTIGASLALLPVIGLLTAIPLLPGGWGVGELAFAYFFAPLGVAGSEAVGLSVVFRLTLLATGLPGGFLWLTARDHAATKEMRTEVEEAEAEAAAAAEGPA